MEIPRIISPGPCFFPPARTRTGGLSSIERKPSPDWFSSRGGVFERCICRQAGQLKTFCARTALPNWRRIGLFIVEGRG